MIFSGCLPTYWWLIISAASVTLSRAVLQVEPNHKLSPRLDKEIFAQVPQGADIKMKNTADSLDNPAQPTSIVDNTLTTKQPSVGYLPSSAITPVEAAVLMNGLTVHLDGPVDTSIKNNDLSSPAPEMTSIPSATSSSALINSLQMSQTNGELQTLQQQQPVRQKIDSAISMPKKGPSGSTSVPGVEVDIQKQMLEDLQQAMDRFLQSQESDLNIPHANPDSPEGRFEQQRPVITEELPLSTFGQLAIDIEGGAGTGFPADYDFEGTLQGSGELVEVLNGRPEVEMKSKSSQQDTPRQSDMKVQRLGDLLLPRTLLGRLLDDRGDQSSPPQPWKVHRPKQIIVSHSFVLPKSFWTQGKLNENLRDLLANVFFRPPRPVAVLDDVQRPAQKEPEGSGEKDSKEPLGPEWIPPKKVSLYSILLQPGNQISGFMNPLRKRSWLSTVNKGDIKRRVVLSKRSHAKLLQQLSHLLPLSRRRHQREISSIQLEDLDFNCEVVIIPKDLPLKTQIFRPPESVLTENMDHAMMCLVPRQNFMEPNARGEIVLTRKEHPGYRQAFRYYIGFSNGIRWYDDFQVWFLENNEIFVMYDETITTEKIEGLFVTRIRVLTVAPDMKLEIRDPHLAKLFQIKPNGQLFINAGPLHLNNTCYEINVTVSSELLNSTKNVSIEILFQSEDDLDDGDQDEVTEVIGGKRKDTEKLIGLTAVASRLLKQTPKNKKTKPLVPAKGTEDVIFSIAIVILFANIVIIGALFVQWYRKKRPVPVVIRRQAAVTAKRVRNVPEPAHQEGNPAQTKAEDTPPENAPPKNEDVAQAGKPGIAVVVVVPDGAPTSSEVEDQAPNPGDLSEGRGSKEKLITV